MPTSGSQKRTGYRRRQFQAEVAQQYCGGNARRVEAVFDWGREAVKPGLQERRSGIRWVDDVSSRGRHETEEKFLEWIMELHSLVESKSQAEPRFQTPLAFTRITAKAVREERLVWASDSQQPLPAERTLRDITSHLGYCLRRIRKTKPQKKFPKPMLSSRS